MGKKALDVLEKYVTWACITSFSTMAIAGILQVVCRYALGKSLDFSEELARYSFIWSVFLGQLSVIVEGATQQYKFS